MQQGAGGRNLADRFRRLAALPEEEEPAEARRARLLRFTLLLGLGVTAAFLAVAWRMMNDTGHVLTGGLLAGLLGLSLAARAGFTRLAALGFLAGLWLYVTASFWLFGGFRTPAASAYAVVALAAALLFGTRGAAAASAAVAASCVLGAVAETRGWMPPAPATGAWMALAMLLASLLGVVGMALYATAELGRAISGLSESESRFRSIVESSPMAILLYRLEPDGRLVLTGSNPNSDRVLGIDVGALVGRTIEEAFPGLAGTEVPDRYRRLCAGGGAWDTEVTYQDDHVRGIYEVHAFQTVPGLLAVMFLDVTEKRRVEAERRRMEEQLRQSQKMEAVGRLAGGIAHDFNNLLMVIMGHGELLRRSLSPGDPRLAKVQHVMGASERAARLVSQLLAFSRKQVLEPQVVDLNDLVAETARMLRPLLGEDVAVVTRLDPALGRARVDPAQIDQVLMNLAVNARDAMPAGGTLVLETKNEDAAPPGAGGARAPGRYVALTVRDTGHGMDEATRARAFEPFFSTKAGLGGTGLGLAMVYGIVQQSGGHVQLESEPGRGSSFRILLPRAHDHEAPGVGDAPAAPPPARGETVVVVEDEPSIRALACEMLQAHGYRTLEAASAEEALGFAVRHGGPIHLLLADVVMPGISGPALAGKFDTVRPGVRVLFMSGYAGDDLVRRGVAEDAEVITKPFTAEALVRRVREVLDR